MHIKFLLYADNLIIYHSNKKLNTLANLQDAINNLKEWSDYTNLRFSINKAQAIHFCKKKQLCGLYYL